MFFRFNNIYTYVLFFVANALILGTLLTQENAQSKMIALFPFVLCVLLLVEFIQVLRKKRNNKDVK